MTKLEDIEKAIEQLSPTELAKLRDWFEELQAGLWDQQIERAAPIVSITANRRAWR